jgi:hypothetical protein
VDLDRRSLTFALGGALVLVLRAGSIGFVYGTRKLEIVLYVASVVAFGLASVLASLVLLPRISSRIFPARFREPAAIFELSVAAFALGIAITTIQFAEVAIREFGDSSPFGE